MPEAPKAFETLKAANTKEYKEVYNTSRWRKLRAVVRMEEPICRECGKDATHTVDHIQPIKDGGAIWDRNNLQGLCKACNADKTRKQGKT
jgi:5-methylcytosine-specific restriction endonuclease McrA